MRVYYFPQDHRSAGEIFKLLPNESDELESIFEIEDATDPVFEESDLRESFDCEYGWNPNRYNYVEADTKAEIVTILQKDIRDWKCMSTTNNALFEIQWRVNVIEGLEE